MPHRSWVSTWIVCTVVTSRIAPSTIIQRTPMEIFRRPEKADGYISEGSMFEGCALRLARIHALARTIAVWTSSHIAVSTVFDGGSIFDGFPVCHPECVDIGLQRNPRRCLRRAPNHEFRDHTHVARGSPRGHVVLCRVGVNQFTGMKLFAAGFRMPMQATPYVNPSRFL